MKRAGCLLLAAAPLVITASVYLFTPGPSDTDASGSGTTTSESAGQNAKSRAEAELAADNEMIAAAPPGLAASAKKELAQKVVSSAENSTLDWRNAYGTIEDTDDGCGYTAGIIGFCTGTHDLLALVERYTKAHPDNALAEYLPALREVDGTDSHEGLDPGFTKAWKAEARVPAFRKAQNTERDRVYFDPAVRLAKLDGLGTLGQFIYYDAMVLHGPGIDSDGFYVLRERARSKAKTPAEGGRERAYLDVFLDIRRKAMRSEDSDHDTTRIDTTRIDTAQRRFLREGNLKFEPPLVWQVYGDTYRVP
ncbi:chitosanase [Streptomyces phyllanthi]|uniref:Chitosanase n=1 Tax=Streptomyces phyllanthi TaxID=1803180 RepID=A0A5N8WE39_9ACTN|nr:chitosanase [Streptomyces phyllanthi]MPY44708.1 chitosanase [Streptomyces phyllanthi]